MLHVKECAKLLKTHEKYHAQQVMVMAQLLIHCKVLPLCLHKRILNLTSRCTWYLKCQLLQQLRMQWYNYNTSSLFIRSFQVGWMIWEPELCSFAVEYHFGWIYSWEKDAPFEIGSLILVIGLSLSTDTE